MGAILDVVREDRVDSTRAHHTESMGAQRSSKSGLREVILAIIAWQSSIQKMEESMAKTLQLAGVEDMAIYKNADKSLNEKMNDMPDDGTKDPDKKGEDKKTEKGDGDLATRLQKWQAEYNRVSQSWQNLETQWNSVIQSLDQNMQTQGSCSQQASQMVAVIIQAVNITTRLLQSPLS